MAGKCNPSKCAFVTFDGRRRDELRELQRQLAEREQQATLVAEYDRVMRYKIKEPLFLFFLPLSLYIYIYTYRVAVLQLSNFLL